MQAMMFDADAMLAQLPRTRPAEVQEELDRKAAEHDGCDYTARERISGFGVAGWGS